MIHQTPLPQLKKDLHVQHFDGETVVLGADGKAHHLRDQASLVFRLLQTGASRGQALGLLTEDSLDLCIAQFEGLGLLHQDFSLSRRSLVKAGMALPLVTTLTLPSPAAAASGSAPTVVITSPMAFDTVGDPVPVDFTTADADGDLLTITFEFESGSLTFVPATPDATSPLPNPATNIAPGALSFVWDSSADLGGPTFTNFRITVNDGCNQGIACVPILVNIGT